MLKGGLIASFLRGVELKGGLIASLLRGYMVDWVKGGRNEGVWEGGRSRGRGRRERGVEGGREVSVWGEGRKKQSV